MTKKRWTPTEAARELGITDRHLRRLAADGVVVDKGGGFDPLPTLQGYLRHVTKDQAGRQARTELAQVETIRKKLLTRRQLGETMTHHEVREFVSQEIWVRHLSAWSKGCSYLYYVMRETFDGDDKRARVVTSQVADAVQHELNRLRDDLEQKLRDLRRDLRDDRRIDQLMNELSGDGTPT